MVRHFADKQCESNGLPKVEFTSEAMDYLSRLPYPGNIRELKNLVERTLLVSGKEILTADDFKSQYQHPIEQKRDNESARHDLGGDRKADYSTNA